MRWPLFTKTQIKKTGVKKTGCITGKRQQGVAIITALLIVTLATTISITISTQLQLDVRRTGNMVAADQSYLYSLLAEKALQAILRDEESRDALIETLINDGIAKQPYIKENAYIEAEVTDLNACININKLTGSNNTNSINPIDAVTEGRLTRLFDNQGMPDNLLQAIADWIDVDLTDRTPDGAEDGYYMNLEKPYRTAQAPLQSISELRLIRGFDDNKVYDRIIALVEGTTNQNSGRFSGPALCAINTTSNTPININTASVEVLESIQPDITQAQIDDILQQRTDGALTTVPAVFTAPNNTGLATESSYYLLKSKVTIGNANNVMYSIIYWDGTNTQTLSRTLRTL